MGIRAKILSITIVILTIGIAAEIMTSSHIFSTEYSKALQSRAYALAESLRIQLDRILSLGIPLEELIGFEKQCKELVERNSGIDYAAVLDSDGRALFHSDPSWNPEEMNLPVTGMKDHGKKTPRSHGGEGIYNVVVPILNSRDEKIATLVVGIIADAIDDKVRHLVKHSAIVSLLTLSIAASLLFFALRLWVTKPLTELFDAIRQLRRSESGFYSEIKVVSNDEIGHVSFAFNCLIKDLNTSHETILLHTESLELLVDKRTAELKEVNGKLERDIAERKKVEEALRESEERFRAVVETAPEAIYIQTQERFTYVNSAALDLFGVTEEDQLIGRMVADQFHPECRPVVRERIRKLNEERKAVPLVAEKILRCDGKEVDVEVSAVPFTYKGEDGALVFVRDSTARKQAEKERIRVEGQLREAQKMEALGTLAGGIAHDFNNILGIIIGYTEMAKWEMPERSPAVSKLQEVLKASKRAKDLVQQILAFSRSNGQEKKPVQVGLIVKEVMKMLRATLPATIDIKMDVDSKAVVLAAPTQIHQVLMNLCTNAFHAMQGDGGIIEVSITEIFAGSESRLPHSGLEPGPYLRLTVKDSGHGIDPSILDRIFDPFFTTKKGVGTGLGLAVVHGIVKSHGGAIEVESLPGRGAIFHVFLPVMESAPIMETEKAAPFHGGHGRILIVDDEPALGMVIKKMLERIGYEVDYITNAIEALKVFRHRSNEKPFDLVITDMTMPQLTGEELAVVLLKLQPSLPVILCTGFSEMINEDKARSIGIRAFIMKPFNLSELDETVRKVMEGREQPIEAGEY